MYIWWSPQWPVLMWLSGSQSPVLWLHKRRARCWWRDCDSINKGLKRGSWSVPRRESPGHVLCVVTMRPAPLMGRPTSLCCVCVSDLGLSLQTQAWLHSYVREQGRMRHCERDGEMERKRERQATGHCTSLHIVMQEQNWYCAKREESVTLALGPVLYSYSYTSQVPTDNIVSNM